MSLRAILSGAFFAKSKDAKQSPVKRKNPLGSFYHLNGDCFVGPSTAVSTPHLRAGASVRRKCTAYSTSAQGLLATRTCGGAGVT
jgi:hypothetical protein